jgi:hypothetical protein
VRPAILAAALLAGCTKSPTTTADRPAANPPRAEPAAAAAEPLGPAVYAGNVWKVFDAYGENVAAADAKFAGQTVEVHCRGTVLRDESGRYYFGTAVEGRDPAEYPNVVAYIAPGHVEAFSKIPPGPRARVHYRARVVGRDARPGAWQGYAVRLEQAEFVQHEES